MCGWHSSCPNEPVQTRAAGRSLSKEPVITIIGPTIRTIGSLCLAVVLLVVVAMRCAAVVESTDSIDRSLTVTNR